MSTVFQLPRPDDPELEDLWRAEQFDRYYETALRCIRIAPTLCARQLANYLFEQAMLEELRGTIR